MTSLLLAAFLVIDLSGGPTASRYPVSRLESVPAGGWSDEYKTTRLVLKELPPGTFAMGTKKDEIGKWFGNHYNEPVNLTVTLTKPFHVGIFEVTQRQWELVTGENPSQHKGARRPVENVSYLAIRGDKKGLGWPDSAAVDDDSFLGRLRARTGLALDLPTEYQWEYACRAGTTTQLGTGKDITDVRECPNVAETCRYAFNRDDGRGGGHREHVEVGAYRPNLWGIYDMHGNVGEWCRDYWEPKPSDKTQTDPVCGPKSGHYWDWRLVRGGTWHEASGTGWAAACRSGFRTRSYWYTTYACVCYPFIGLRLVCEGKEAK